MCLPWKPQSRTGPHEPAVSGAAGVAGSTAAETTGLSTAGSLVRAGASAGRELEAPLAAAGRRADSSRQAATTVTRRIDRRDARNSPPHGPTGQAPPRPIGPSDCQSPSAASNLARPAAWSWPTRYRPARPTPVPEPELPVPDLDFGAFDALTFDCYGTLIDWETGILAGAPGGLRGPRARRPPTRSSSSATPATRPPSRPGRTALPEVLGEALRASQPNSASNPTTRRSRRSAARSRTGRRSPTRPTRWRRSRRASGWA